MENKYYHKNNNNLTTSNEITNKNFLIYLTNFLEKII